MTYKIHQSVLNHKKIAKSHTHNLFLPQFPCSCSTTSTSSTYLSTSTGFFFLLFSTHFGCCSAPLHSIGWITLHIARSPDSQRNLYSSLRCVLFSSSVRRPTDLSCENGFNVCLAHSTHIGLCLLFIRIGIVFLIEFFLGITPVMNKVYRQGRYLLDWSMMVLIERLVYLIVIQSVGI